MINERNPVKSSWNWLPFSSGGVLHSKNLATVRDNLTIIYEANEEELYNSRVERLLAEYLIDTPLLEFLPPPLCVRLIVSGI